MGVLELGEKVRILDEDGAFEGVIVDVSYCDESPRALVDYENDEGVSKQKWFSYEQLEDALDTWYEVSSWE